MKPSYLAPFAVSIVLALAGCHQAPASQTGQGAAAGQVSVSDGKLVLPAVSGNPGAAYFTVTNGTAQAVSLAAASVEGAAKAEMHETSAGSMAPLAAVPLAPGAAATFARGGKHVMVFAVPRQLKAGDTARLTLTFAGGKTVSGPLSVEAAGGGEEMH